jgi:phosphatidylserine decarboxylase precursor
VIEEFILAALKTLGAEMDFRRTSTQTDITNFISHYSIYLNELMQTDITKYECLADFFARAIRVDYYRPIVKGKGKRMRKKSRNNILSPADCRLMTFDHILDSHFWINGDEFTFEKLLKISMTNFDYYDHKYALHDGCLAICRLTIQDYHRFHFPVSGMVTDIRHVAGDIDCSQQLSLSSQDANVMVSVAIHNPTLNVLSLSKRVVIEIDDESSYGKLLMVVIGEGIKLFADQLSQRLVTKTKTKSKSKTKTNATKREKRAASASTAKVTPNVPLYIGARVVRGDLAGEFRQGTSMNTIVLLFEKDVLQFDEDLMVNSNEAWMETLVNARETIGKVKRRKRTRKSTKSTALLP